MGISNLYPPRAQIKRQKMIYHCKFGEFGVMEGQVIFQLWLLHCSFIYILLSGQGFSQFLLSYASCIFVNKWFCTAIDSWAIFGAIC